MKTGNCLERMPGDEHRKWFVGAGRRHLAAFLKAAKLGSAPNWRRGVRTPLVNRDRPIGRVAVAHVQAVRG
jgi:hypothetical protein